MPIRTIYLPHDLTEIAKVISQGYQYPENPEWSLQPDQGKQVLNLAKTVQKLWPLIWLAQRVSPIVRDGLYGYVWEEEKKVIAVSTYRRITKDTWRILDVVVVPGFRRRGIALQLLKATLADIRARIGKKIILEVIAGNLPALSLYQRLGFECFDSRTFFRYEKDDLPQLVPLPAGYICLPSLDWQAYVNFERHITPNEIQRFASLTKDEHHGLVKLIMGMIQKSSGIRKETIGLATVTGEIVAVGNYSAQMHSKGINNLSLQVNSVPFELAQFLIRQLLHTTREISPDNKIEFLIPNWQKIVIDAALDAGCIRLYEEHRMGKTF